MSDKPRQSYAYRRWTLLSYWVLMFVATHWPEIERYGLGWPIPHFDKLAHAALYGGWVAVWWWLLAAGGRQVSSAAANWLTLGGLAYALVDEATQAIVDRTPALTDIAADLVGIICSLAVLQWWQRRRSGHQSR